MFEVRPAMTAKLVAGVKLNVRVTLTTLVSGANPAALAVIDAVPGVTPVICGFAAGMRTPAGMNTLGVIVATLVSLLCERNRHAAGRCVDAEAHRQRPRFDPVRRLADCPC